MGRPRPAHDGPQRGARGAPPPARRQPGAAGGAGQIEDRLTPALWLDLSDGPADDGLGREGVERGSWWANAKPDRREFPRTIPEFSVLGLYEVTDSFTPPSSGFLFRRFPRPAQGSLSGRPTVGLLVVMITPLTPEVDQPLRDWADFVHIRHIADASVPGYTMITPYVRVGGDSPRYLHLYEMDCEDPEAAFQAMTPLVAERLGGSFGTPVFDAWATHPALQIDYVNTFRRIARPADGSTGGATR